MTTTAEKLAEQVEAFLAAYRAKYGNDGKGGVRANAPLREEAGKLADAFNEFRISR